MQQIGRAVYALDVTVVPVAALVDPMGILGSRR
jgi:hypothetical protein